MTVAEMTSCNINCVRNFAFGRAQLARKSNETSICVSGNDYCHTAFTSAVRASTLGKYDCYHGECVFLIL